MKKPKYVVEYNNGKTVFFNTKKDISSKYKIKLTDINKSLSGFPLREFDTNKIYWVKYYTCKHCEDYMVESKNCENCSR